MKKSFGIAVAILFILAPVALVHGQNVVNNNTAPNVVNNNTTPVTSAGTPVSVQNPLGVTSFCGLIKLLLNGALQIGIPIAVLFIVYAGFKFVMARGNSEKLIEARANMLWTIIGIGIFLGAWLLAQLIANTVNNLQAGSNSPSVISCQ